MIALVAAAVTLGCVFGWLDAERWVRKVSRRFPADAGGLAPRSRTARDAATRRRVPRSSRARHASASSQPRSVP